MDDDHNNIMEIVTIKYAFKTVKLIATLMIVVFILSMLTLLLFDQADVIMGTDSAEWAQTDHFWADYGIAEMSAGRIMLVAIYYSQTTLSTVGFGDFHPKSSFERLLTSVILVTGVACFSLVMENFFQLMDTLQSLNQPIEELEKLNLFYGVMRQFNHGYRY